MRLLSILPFLFLMISDVSGIDYRSQNDSLARIKTIADAKVKKDERVAVEIFGCDSCVIRFDIKGGTEKRTFYDSDGFIIAMHECYANGFFDNVEKYYYDEFGNEIRHEYFDQKTGQHHAKGKIRKDTSWIDWEATNSDTNYFEVNNSINTIEPDGYTYSKLKKTVKSKYDTKGRLVERIERDHLQSDTVPSRSKSYQGPGKDRKDYVVDSTFRCTYGNQKITQFSFNENGNIVKEAVINKYGYLEKKINYIIDGGTKDVVSEKIKPTVIDTFMDMRIKDLIYKDGDVIMERDSIGKLFKGSLSWQVTERRKQYRKHKIVKVEQLETYPNSKPIQGKIIYRYDRLGNKIYEKNGVGRKNKYYELKRWKYTRDTLLVSAMTYNKYYIETNKKDTSRIAFRLKNEYSRSGTLVYSKKMSETFLFGHRTAYTRLPSKEKPWITETETFYYPDSILEFKMEYGIKNNLICRTESRYTEKQELIKTEEADVIHNDRYVKEKIVIDENKYMITEKLNDVFLNTNTIEVLRYPF